MGMQTDVRSSRILLATGDFLSHAGTAIPRSRIKAVYVRLGGAAGSVVIRSGGAAGPIILDLSVPASGIGVGPVYTLLPGQGILAEATLHGSLSNVVSCTVFYG